MEESEWKDGGRDAIQKQESIDVILGTGYGCPFPASGLRQATDKWQSPIYSGGRALRTLMATLACVHGAAPAGRANARWDRPST